MIIKLCIAVLVVAIGRFALNVYGNIRFVDGADVASKKYNEFVDNIHQTDTLEMFTAIRNKPDLPIWFVVGEDEDSTYYRVNSVLFGDINDKEVIMCKGTKLNMFEEDDLNAR